MSGSYSDKSEHVQILEALDKGQCHLLEAGNLTMEDDGLHGDADVVAIIPRKDEATGWDFWCVVSVDDIGSWVMRFPTRLDTSGICIRKDRHHPKTIAEALAQWRADCLQVVIDGCSHDVEYLHALPAGVCNDGRQEYVVSWREDGWFTGNVFQYYYATDNENDWNLYHGSDNAHLTLKPAPATDPPADATATKDTVQHWFTSVMERLERIESHLKNTSGGSPLTH